MSRKSKFWRIFGRVILITLQVVGVILLFTFKFLLKMSERTSNTAVEKSSAPVDDGRKVTARFEPAQAREVYVCKYCGTQGRDPYFASSYCNYSPTKSHSLIRGSDTYVCKFCGTLGRDPYFTSGYCSYSPNNHHVLTQGRSMYVCKYCGEQSQNPLFVPNTCFKSPHKKHELID